MPYTIAIQSNAMCHAPGMFAYLRRMLHASKAKDRKVAREALHDGLYLCDDVVAAIERGNVCAEVDPEDNLNGRLLIHVETSLRKPQRAYLRSLRDAGKLPRGVPDAELSED